MSFLLSYLVTGNALWYGTTKILVPGCGVPRSYQWASMAAIRLSNGTILRPRYRERPSHFLCIRVLNQHGQIRSSIRCQSQEPLVFVRSRSSKNLHRLGQTPSFRQQIYRRSRVDCAICKYSIPQRWLVALCRAPCVILFIVSAAPPLLRSRYDHLFARHLVADEPC